jgi:hypothetical protein
VGTQERSDPRSQEAALSFTEDQLLDRVKRWQQKLSALGVAHFRVLSVEIVDELDEEKAGAAAFISEFYDSVYFEFRKDDLEDASDLDIDERIIHEWVHVAMRDLDQAIESVERWMPDPSREDFKRVVNFEREGLVERLARAMYALHSETC